MLIGDNQVPVKCWATLQWADKKVQETPGLDTIKGLHYKAGHAYNEGDRVGGIGTNALSRVSAYTPDHFVEAYNKSTKKKSITGA